MLDIFDHLGGKLKTNPPAKQTRYSNKLCRICSFDLLPSGATILRKACVIALNRNKELEP
jgi:hypothetical protein